MGLSLRLLPWAWKLRANFDAAGLRSWKLSARPLMEPSSMLLKVDSESPCFSGRLLNVDRESLLSRLCSGTA